MNKYDIIGDIHGCADELESLLQKLGYETEDGFYRHPERNVIFLGDFIDRGSAQARTLEIVRPMIDSGTAQAVMGNHEFNAICYATETASGYVRAHIEKNNGQHEQFLKEFPFSSSEHQDAIDWFKNLPLYLDFGDMGIVHACWCNDSLDKIQPFLDEQRRLNEQAYLDYGVKSSAAHVALERILKGPEHQLPPELHFNDKDGHLRKNARISWWQANENKPVDRLEFGGAVLSEEKMALLNAHEPPPPFVHPEKLVFIGHYWLVGEPAPLSNRVACVDYSVAKDGKLAAYRWDGETEIQADKFVWV